MVTPCINDIHHFNIQLMHTTLKNAELLKHFKISETATTCFGLAKYLLWLPDDGFLVNRNILEQFT